MSLNKLTDTTIKQYLNLGCDAIACNSLLVAGEPITSTTDYASVESQLASAALNVTTSFLEYSEAPQLVQTVGTSLDTIADGLNTAIQVVETGAYQISYSMDFDSAALDINTLRTAVTVNNVEYTQSLTKQRLLTGTDACTASKTFVLILTAGDILIPAVASSTVTTVQVVGYSINAVKLG